MANGYYLQIIASETSHDNTANTSNVSVTVKAVSPVALEYGGWNYDSTTCYITCNGVQRSFVVSSYDFRNSQTITLGTLTFNSIQHNTDGTKTINISSSWNTDNPYVLSSGGSQTLTASTNLKLTDIPRQANLTGADNFNDEQNPKISYSNGAGNSVTTLQACISLTGASDDIKYRDISKTDNTYTFNLTEAERNVLRNATTTSNTRSVIFFVKTVLNGVTYHSTLTRTLTIVNNQPVIGSITYQDTNTSVTDITKNNQVIVQNKSLLRVNFTAPTMKKGATLVKHTFTLNGVTKESTSASGYVDFGAVNSASNLTLSTSVIDSRGNKSTNNKTIAITPYNMPTMMVTLNRLNNYEDTTYLTVDGNISSVVNNVMTIKYRYKVKGGTYGSYTTIQDNVKQTLTLDKNNEYIFNVVVSDLLGGSNSLEYTLNKGVFPLFIDTGKNSIGVNMFPTKSKSLEIDGYAYAENLPQAKSEDLTDLEQTFSGGLLQRSGLYTVSIGNIWYNLINLRHRNGFSDGVSYGLQLRNLLTNVSSKLQLRQQSNGNWGVWRTIQEEAEELFNNSSGTTSTITLTSSSANYSYLEILFADNNGKEFNSVKVPSPNGKIVDLVCTEPAPTNNPMRTYIRASLWTISGNSITHTSSTFTTLTNAGITMTSDQYIKIYKVLGYR